MTTLVLGTELEGGKGAYEVLALYSPHCLVNAVLKSGDLQMHLFWNKNTLFCFGLILSRTGLVTGVGKICRLQ